MLELLQINYLVKIRIRLIAFVYLIFFGSLVSTGSVVNADQDNIKAHGFNFFGELKYPNDFQHLDYVNPNAPKGGEISIWGFGTFDSMNPYSRKDELRLFHLLHSSHSLLRQAMKLDLHMGCLLKVLSTQRSKMGYFSTSQRGKVF